MSVRARLLGAALAVGAAAAIGLAPGAVADHSTGTYGEYSLIDHRAAGQYWTADRSAGQWAWSQRGSTSPFALADPARWPPRGAERFERTARWVLLPGWSDGRTFYRQVMSAEWVGNGDCERLRPLRLDPQGRQHYVRWTIPRTSYCLIGEGRVMAYRDGRPTGRTFAFRHRQVWHPPAPCSNRWIGDRVCIRQAETWYDRNPGLGPLPAGNRLVKRTERTQYLARGLGMGFIVDQTYPTRWRAEGRYYWRW